MTETATIEQQPKEATFIPVQTLPGKGPQAAGLLGGAAQTVRQTEPLTLQWLALQDDDAHFAIIDFFAEEAGRTAHFAGQVAGALKQAAPSTLVGGWDDGVVAHIQNSKVLGFVRNAASNQTARLATRIAVEANPGQEDALAKLLAGAAAIVRETEPGTLLWYALRIDATHFAIFDVFETEAGRSAHFAGKVADALKANAGTLVKGGWDAGVVANIKNFTVLSSTY